MTFDDEICHLIEGLTLQISDSALRDLAGRKKSKDKQTNKKSDFQKGIIPALIVD